MLACVLPGSTGGDDPGLRLRGLRRRKQLHRAGHEKAEYPHHSYDPVHVCDHRDTLPARGMFHPNLQVFPDSTWVVAGEIRRGLVEKPDLVVPRERFENGWNKNPVIILPCDLSLAG